MLSTGVACVCWETFIKQLVYSLLCARSLASGAVRAVTAVLLGASGVLGPLTTCGVSFLRLVSAGAAALAASDRHLLVFMLLNFFA